MNAPRNTIYNRQQYAQIIQATDKFVGSTASCRLAVKAVISGLTPTERLKLQTLESYPPQWGGGNTDPKYNQIIDT